MADETTNRVVAQLNLPLADETLDGVTYALHREFPELRSYRVDDEQGGTISFYVTEDTDDRVPVSSGRGSSFLSG